MKSTGMAKRKPESLPVVGKKYPRGQNPDGRTKKAYATQPVRAKWPCWKCDAVRARILREASSPKEREKTPDEVSFPNRKRLLLHTQVHHS